MKIVNHLLLGCPGFKENLDALWDKLKTKAGHLNPIDGDQIVNFITNLDQHHKMLLFIGGLQLPFDNMTTNSIKRFVTAGVGKFTKFARKSCMSWGFHGLLTNHFMLTLHL